MGIAKSRMDHAEEDGEVSALTWLAGMFEVMYGLVHIPFQKLDVTYTLVSGK